MDNINLYSGTLVYWAGVWTKDIAGVNFVTINESLSDMSEYNFKAIPAKTLDQLGYILSKRIQKEKNTGYPIYIDWQDIQAKVEGTVPTSSERFDDLVTSHK